MQTKSGAAPHTKSTRRKRFFVNPVNHSFVSIGPGKTSALRYVTLSRKCSKIKRAAGVVHTSLMFVALHSRCRTSRSRESCVPIFGGFESNCCANGK